VTFAPELHARAACELRAHGSAVAERAVEAQWAVPDPRTKETSLRDARANVDHLAEAIALGDPEAFVVYVTWLQGMMSAVARVPPSLLADHLGELAIAVRDRIGPDLAELAGQYIACALRRLGEELP
jgi:hypothetical protein